MIRSSLTKLRGVSFLEVAFGVLILGLTVGPLVGSFSSVNRGVPAGVHELMASQFAMELLDQLRPLRVDLFPKDLPAITIGAFPDSKGVPEKTALLPGLFLFASPMPPAFKKRVISFDSVIEKTVNLEDGSTGSIRLIRIEVRIFWEEPGTPEKVFTAAISLVDRVK